MLLSFFDELRERGLPVTFGELSDLIQALEQHLVFADIDEFYYLSRTCLIKDEKNFDKFDLAFKAHLAQLAKYDNFLEKLLPERFARASNAPLNAAGQTEAFGTMQGLKETYFKPSDQEYDGHFGRNKGVGSAGISNAFAGSLSRTADGVSATSTNIGKGALKAWDRREYRELDDRVQLGTRNIKMALRRLRQFARTGAEEELDLPATIRSTAHQGGLLDIKMLPQRHNSVKVLLFFDIGGSMDAYVRTCEELFSAARSEFKHMEYFYFHNFIYDRLWTTNKLNQSQIINTFDVLHKYGRDYKVIFVGDAAIGTQEILRDGGSVDFPDSDAGANWLKRVTDTYPKVVWLNPEPENFWQYSESTRIIKDLMEDRMYPLTLGGIEKAMAYLG